MNGPRHAQAAALARALAELGPPALLDWKGDAPQARVDEDGTLLDRALTAGAPSHFQRIWTNDACLVVTRAQARHPRFEEAVHRCGLPVAIRRSGGTAVVHHEGTLQISLALTGAEHRLEQGYEVLSELIIRALAQLGVVAAIGPAPGSACDGRFNILAGNRKLAGTAAFAGQRDGRSAGVFHACIAVGGNVAEDLERIRRFETALGTEDSYIAGAHCTVEQLLS